MPELLFHTWLGLDSSFFPGADVLLERIEKDIPF